MLRLRDTLTPAPGAAPRTTPTNALMHQALVALIALAAAATACDPDAVAPADASDDGPAGIGAPQLADAGTSTSLDLDAGDMIAYVVDWSWEGARWQEGAWVFESDLGYTIAIEAAYASTSLLELVPCADADAIHPDDAPTRGDLTLAKPTTQAAHSGSRDDSAAIGELAQALLDPAPLVFGAGLAGESPYCDLHLLAAPYDGEADDGTALDGDALVLRGWWSAPGDDTRRELAASINLQRGGVVALAGRTTGPEGLDLPDDLAATLVITRYPARAFDGLAIEEFSDAELAYEVLGRLMQGARAEVARAE